MPKDTIPIDEAQVRLAVTALLKHLAATAAASGRKDLLGDDARQPIHLSLHLKKLPGRASNKPVRIAVPHTLLDPADGVECCVIVPDPASDFKDKLAAAPVPGFTKVLSVSKLRSDFGQFKDRAALLKGYDAFFADDRVVRMMPQLLGTEFFRKKKHPAPVRLTGAGWARELAAARDATYVHVGWGQCVAVRVGRAHMPADAVVANVMAAARGAVHALPGRWRNVASVGLGSTGSVELPVWKSLAGSGGGGGRPVVAADAAGGDDDNGSDSDSGSDGGSAGGGAGGRAGAKRRRPSAAPGAAGDGDDDDVAALEALLAEEAEAEAEEGGAAAAAAAVAAASARRAAKSAAKVAAKAGAAGTAAVAGAAPKAAAKAASVAPAAAAPAAAVAAIAAPAVAAPTAKAAKAAKAPAAAPAATAAAPAAHRPASLLSRAGVQQLKAAAAAAAATAPPTAPVAPAAPAPAAAAAGAKRPAPPAGRDAKAPKKAKA